MEEKRLFGGLQRILRCGTLSFVLLFVCNMAMAQGLTLKGKVVFDSDGAPVLGAAVMVEGTSNGVTTDLDGKFEIKNVPAKGTLAISYVGYKTVKAVAQNGKFYTIKMSEDSQLMDDVVVVGYGTMSKKEVTGAVAQLKSEELERVASSDLGTMLQGQIAGVSVQSSTGEPGAGSNIQIRGITSISGDNDPLYVVDGVPYESDPGLNANEIASVDILKDAASAAIYGTRGAAGVILITTKKGQAGKVKVSFTGYYGVQKITSDVDEIDITQVAYRDIIGDLNLNGQTGDDATSSIQYTEKKFYNNSRIYELLINDYAPIQNYGLNINGGSAGTTFNISANYFSQDGVIINSFLDRYSVRANINTKRDKWTFNANMMIKMENKQAPGWGLLTYAQTYSPTMTQVDVTADFENVDESSDQAANMAAIMSRIETESTTKTGGYNGNFLIEYEIRKNLKFSTRLGLTYQDAQYTSFKPTYEIYDEDGDLAVRWDTISTLTETNTLTGSTTFETMLNWNKKYKKHDFKLTGVFSMEQYTNKYIKAYCENIISSDAPVLNSGTSDMYVSSGTTRWTIDRTSSLVGMLARMQYNYAGRYMMSASLRRDGSSRFAPENRWGMFPSVSMGWNISDEKFFSPLKKTITSLKFRASYGTTGNQNFQDYLYSVSYVSTNDYVFGTGDSETYYSGMMQEAFSNSDISWETTQQINVGLDFSFWRNKLTFTADVFQSSKKNMLLPLAVPPSNGTGTSGTVTMNVGDMTNSGIEFALGYRNRYKKLNYNANLTFTLVENEVVDIGGSSDMYYFSDGQPMNSTSGDSVTVVKEGYEAGAYFMMPTAGIINTEAKLYEYRKLVSSAKMGDLMYVDSNNDGVLDDEDRVYCGSGIPEYEIGFNCSANWKGFDIYMNWYVSLGNEIINATDIMTYSKGTNPNLVYQWSENYPTSALPTYDGSSDNYREYADIWVEDGSFIRLKSVSLGYSLQPKVLKKLKITKCRFYVAADNLFTITKYTGANPEVGNNGLSRRGLDYCTYPVSSQIRGGIQLGF